LIEPIAKLAGCHSRGSGNPVFSRISGTRFRGGDTFF
jgi:hypothetical protein